MLKLVLDLLLNTQSSFQHTKIHQRLVANMMRKKLKNVYRATILLTNYKQQLNQVQIQNHPVHIRIHRVIIITSTAIVQKPLSDCINH